MINNIETADLHTLLDSLTGGEHVKATWTYGENVISSEGPVHIDGAHCSCHGSIRWDDGDIPTSLTSFEVTYTDGMTVTRDDEEALHALLDSLEDGETITAEWSSKAGVMTLTGAVRTIGSLQEVCGYQSVALRRNSRAWLHPYLQYVTVHRPVVHRWERDLDE